MTGLPVDQPGEPLPFGDHTEPSFSQQGFDLAPGRGVDEEVVPFDYDERGVRRDGDLGGDGFVDGPFEAGSVDGVVDLGEEAPEQAYQAPPVECVHGSLAVMTAEPVGEVKPVHRQVHCDRPGVR